MTGDRHTLRIANEAVRAKALHWISKAPIGWLVEFSPPRRSLDQNAKLWSLLSDISRQYEHQGQRYEPEDYKVLFMIALGKEMRLAPAIDGNGFVPLGTRSSKLTKAEMSDLIEYIQAWGAQQGIRWSDHGFENAARAA